MAESVAREAVGPRFVPLVVGLLTGVLTTQLNLGIDALTGTDPAAKLAARETIVLNPSLTAVDRSLGPWPEPAEDDFARFMRKRVERLAPRVEIVLFNSGDRTAILNRMRFTVREQLHLPTCYLQGDLLVAEAYDITLRRRMRVGQAVSSRPLRRKLAPDEPERLEFRFRLPPFAHPLDYRDDNYFYRLDVTVFHDDAAGPVNVGTVVVSLPSGPTEDQIWTRADERHLQLPSVSVPAEAVACMEANSDRLRRFLTGPGKRSAQLRLLGRRLAAPAQYVPMCGQTAVATRPLRGVPASPSHGAQHTVGMSPGRCSHARCSLRGRRGASAPGNPPAVVDNWKLVPVASPAQRARRTSIASSARRPGVA